MQRSVSVRVPAGQPKPKKTYDIVQQGIKELYAHESPEVDIVAVPGLGAHPEECWRSKTDFNWLTDKNGLAKDFPRSRILLYMYQSAWVGELKVRQFMHNIAWTLLNALVEARKDHPRRPIVFIGHSMGGLVIAKTIFLAEVRKETIGKIFEAITGCVFFGTPFGGCKLAGAASLIGQISEFFKLDLAFSSKLLELMETGNEGLRELTNDFVRLVTKLLPKIELYCFYEEKPTDWNGKIGLTLFKVPIPKKYEDFVTPESASLLGIDCIGLARAHSDLVKFDSFKDTQYQLIRGPLRSIIHGAPLIAKNRFNSTRGIDRELVKGVLEALVGVQVEKKRKQVTQGIISSSWIVQEEEYKQWTKKGDRKIDCLWVLGPEGKGKLGAAIAAIEHIDENVRQEESKNSGNAATLLAYFLCDGTPDCSSPEKLLKSLLRQLINQQEGLATYAKHLAKADTKTGQDSGGKAQAFLTVENLWQSLQDMLTDDLIGTVYFVINNVHAMDEDADSTRKLMEFINSELLLRNARAANVKWLLTSQDRHSIRQALNTPAVRIIDLDDEKYGNQVQHELRIHAQKKVAALGVERGYNKALTYFAGSLIGRRAQNTQWIDITITQLSELPPDAKDLKVRSLLERIPQSLNALLDRAWLSVLDPKDDDVEDIKEMLRTLIITFDDPTEEELSIMTGFSSDVEMKDHLCNLLLKCRPLIQLRKLPKRGSKISFMNTVVKAYLLENSERLLGLSVEETRWQHGILALRNFSHVVDRINKELLEAKVAAENKALEDSQKIAEAAENASEAEAEDDDDDDDDEETSVADMDNDYYDDDDDYSEEEEALDEEHDENHVEQDPSKEISKYAVKHWLHHASKATVDIAETLSGEEEFWKRDSAIRKRWLEIYNKETNHFDGFEPDELTGLHIAASVGFSQLVSALLKNGYEGERDIRDTLENTPLHLAAFFGRPNITEILLNSGANIDDGKETNVSTPLAMAAINGHVKVMSKLLKRGADPNSYGDGVPVINEAIASGNMEAVRLLVEHGSRLALDSEDPDSDILPPLAVSAFLSDSTMFNYLLEACADKIPHREYDKAFVHSAAAGRIDVVKRLLEFKHEQSVFQEALESATSEQNWEIVLLLLDTCSNLNCDKTFYEAAVGTDDQDKLLPVLWKYAGGTISRETLNNSLYEAVDHEKESTVKTLLEDFNADANATGEEYGNALTASAYDGTMVILKLLLEHGAEINSPNGWPLQAAVSQEHKEVIDFLLENKVDINACFTSDYFFSGTALQAACEWGHVEIAKQLLKEGANPNLGAGDESCPIIEACRRGEAEILESLLEYGAQVNIVSGPDKSTPLVYAASTMDKESIGKLLNAGADVNLPDSEGETVLIYSAHAGDAELVGFLLGKGANLLQTNDSGINALMAASNAGNEDCVKILVQATSRLFVKLSEGIKQGSHDIMYALQSTDFSGLEPEDDEDEDDEDQDEDGEDEKMEDAEEKEHHEGIIEDKDAAMVLNNTIQNSTGTGNASVTFADQHPVQQQPAAELPTQENHMTSAINHIASKLATSTLEESRTNTSSYQGYQDYEHYDPNPPSQPQVPQQQAAPQVTFSTHTSVTSQSSITTEITPTTSISSASQVNFNPYAPPPPEPSTTVQTQQSYTQQSYQANPDSQSYSNYAEYQRPSRKPINSTPVNSTSAPAEPPKPEAYKNTYQSQASQDYSSYPAAQDYQTQQGLQAQLSSQRPQSNTQSYNTSPRPNAQSYNTSPQLGSQSYDRPQIAQSYGSQPSAQGYHSPQPSIQGYTRPQTSSEGHHSPKPSAQGYQSPPLNNQSHNSPRPSIQGYPSPSPHQGYQNPPPPPTQSLQSYQSAGSSAYSTYPGGDPNRRPSSGQGYQSATPSQGYQSPPKPQAYQPPPPPPPVQPYETQDANQHYANQGYQPQNNAQSNQKAKFRWDQLW